MELVIKYDDGTTEVVPAKPMANAVSAWGSWQPGIELEYEPERCHWGSDFFATRMNEGHVRVGREDPYGDEEPPVQGFSWEIVGTEEEACRQMMARWIARLGSTFDPEASAGDYLYGGLLQVLADGEAKSYEDDRQCWSYYFDDARAAAVLQLAAAGLEPRWLDSTAGHSP